MKYFAIGVVVGLIAMYLLRPVVPRDSIYPKTIHDTIEIKSDSIEYRDSIQYKWRDEKIDSLKYLRSIKDLKDSLIFSKDSVGYYKKVYATLKDYYSTYKYSDTLKNDSVAYIKLIEDVTRNQIKNRTLIYKNKVKPYIINEKALYLDLTTSYIGLSLDMNYPVDFLGGWDYRSRGVYFGVRYRIGGK